MVVRFISIRLFSFILVFYSRRWVFAQKTQVLSSVFCFPRLLLRFLLPTMLHRIQNEVMMCVAQWNSRKWNKSLYLFSLSSSLEFAMSVRASVVFLQVAADILVSCCRKYLGTSRPTWRLKGSAFFLFDPIVSPVMIQNHCVLSLRSVTFPPQAAGRLIIP